MPIVFAQEWIESEAGWGIRPDGYRVYKTLEDAKLDTKKRLDEQKAYFDTTLGLNIVPHEYIRPAGDPITVTVGPKVMEKLNLAGSGGIFVNHIAEIEYKEDLKPTRPMKKVNPPKTVQPAKTKEMFAVKVPQTPGRYSMNPNSVEEITLSKEQKNSTQKEFVEVANQDMINLKTLSEQDLASLLSRVTNELLNRHK